MYFQYWWDQKICLLYQIWPWRSRSIATQKIGISTKLFSTSGPNLVILARSKLSFAARDLKCKNKINDTWTVDGRIKIRNNYNRIVNIETMADLEKYMWKSLNISKW